MFDPHVADGEVWICECGQRSDRDVRYAGRLHRARGGRAEREQAGDRDRVEVLDRIDDVLIVVGLEDLYLKQTQARQFGGHPAAGLHRHLAHRHIRHHVQHHAALAPGEVARGEVGPIAQ